MSWARGRHRSKGRGMGTDTGSRSGSQVRRSGGPAVLPPASLRHPSGIPPVSFRRLLWHGSSLTAVRQLLGPRSDIENESE